ncbi:hypothetical protein OIU84_023188 [Salix udensis]|uniref:PORR domain-containing protein n=1 Tax=Salix udensis TaxID=889485 RepID=A0AAD6PFK0_9ROSI|nr:hypothetical protein OIU84_023188 [Salix udensis]
MMVSLYSTKLPHQLNQARTFIACRIKWVCDPYLDTVVSKEKNLKQVISFKNQLISSPSKSLPLSTLSLLKPYFNLSTTALNFFHKYYTVFSQFQPSPSLPFHFKLTPQAFSLHKEEQLILKSQPLRDDTVKRLAKFLMLSGAKRLPLHIVDRFKYDLGLPHDYITALLSDYPEYFSVCEDKDCLTNNDSFFLELVSWKDELAVSEMEKRVSLEDLRNVKRGERIGFPLNFPDGFDLKKKVRDWVFEWQVSKKTEKENVLRLGDYLGFGNRFTKALVSSTKKGMERNAKYKSREEENGSSESEFEDVGSSDSNLEGANNDGTRKMKM